MILRNRLGWDTGRCREIRTSKPDLGLKAHRRFGGDRPEISSFLRSGMHTCRYFVRSTWILLLCACLRSKYVYGSKHTTDPDSN